MLTTNIHYCLPPTLISALHHNNLKQVGLGLANYESSLQQFPTQIAHYQESNPDGSPRLGRVGAIFRRRRCTA